MSHFSGRDVAENYFIKLAVELFGEELLWIVNTDSYIRQPCYSSCSVNYFYFIFNKVSETLFYKIKYINGEFPEYIINYITEDELDKYPSQGKWQFCFSPIIYGRDTDFLPLKQDMADHVLALSQAIIGVGHIARLYYLSDLNEKKCTWAIRQLGWAFRYAENGIVKLCNYIFYDKYELPSLGVTILADIQWLAVINSSWHNYERLFLSDF